MQASSIYLQQFQLRRCEKRFKNSIVLQPVENRLGQEKQRRYVDRIQWTVDQSTIQCR